MQNIRIVFNTLTADDKYYLFNRDNTAKFSDAIISETSDIFTDFFAIWKSRFNFEHFPKNDDPHS